MPDTTGKAGRNTITPKTGVPMTRKGRHHEIRFKKLHHPEHDSGHGKATLASAPATFNLIALLMQSACRMICSRWKAARRRWVARYRMPDQLNILANHVVFGGRDRFLVTIATDALPEQPP